MSSSNRCKIYEHFSISKSVKCVVGKVCKMRYRYENSRTLEIQQYISLNWNRWSDSTQTQGKWIEWMYIVERIFPLIASPSSRCEGVNLCRVQYSLCFWLNWIWVRLHLNQIINKLRPCLLTITKKQNRTIDWTDPVKHVRYCMQ